MKEEQKLYRVTLRGLLKMKTTKFRIWNGMEMVYDVTSGKFGTFYVNPEKGDGLNPEDTASLTVNTTKYHKNTPLMQFTGKKDIEGVEIYEGDIVENKTKAKNFDNRTGKYEYHIDTTITTDVVKFNEHWCSFEFTKRTEIGELKIKGNIYQNAELLQDAV